VGGIGSGGITLETLWMVAVGASSTSRRNESRDSEKPSGQFLGLIVMSH
jgi:hypothetical protein